MVYSCLSVVCTLRPNTPRHLEGSGLSLVPMCRLRFDIGELEWTDLWIWENFTAKGGLLVLSSAAVLNLFCSYLYSLIFFFLLTLLGKWGGGEANWGEYYQPFYLIPYSCFCSCDWLIREWEILCSDEREQGSTQVGRRREKGRRVKGGKYARPDKIWLDIYTQWEKAISKKLQFSKISAMMSVMSFHEQ